MIDFFYFCEPKGNRPKSCPKIQHVRRVLWMSFLQAHKRLHIEEAVHALQKHGFEAQSFQTRDEAVRFITK